MNVMKSFTRNVNEKFEKKISKTVCAAWSTFILYDIDTCETTIQAFRNAGLNNRTRWDCFAYPLVTEQYEKL